METKRKLIIFLLVLLIVRYTNGQNSDQINDTTYERIYNEAVIDAMVANESEICSTLVVIRPDNKYLYWSNGYVLVVTWTASCSKYTVGDTVSTSWGEIWVTVVPELKDLYKKNPVSTDKIALRTEQILGLPLNSPDSCFVEIWVKPKDLLRPAYDNEIDKNYSENYFPDKVRSDYITWFNNNIISSYYPSKGTSKYPWTRLGYTYDWGNPDNKIGLSEFIIRKDSKVIIRSKQSTENYLH